MIEVILASPFSRGIMSYTAVECIQLSWAMIISELCGGWQVLVESKQANTRLWLL